MWLIQYLLWPIRYWLDKRAERKFWHDVYTDANIPNIMTIGGQSILFAPPGLREILLTMDRVRDNDPLSDLLPPKPAIS